MNTFSRRQLLKGLIAAPLATGLPRLARANTLPIRADIAKLKGNKAPRPAFISLAGTLASYNEGKIGPGHCDEDRLSSRVE